MWTTYCHVFEEDFQLIFMNHIRLLIRNQCGSHIIHGLPNPLAFQQNYSRYDGPSESGSFFHFKQARPNGPIPKNALCKLEFQQNLVLVFFFHCYYLHLYFLLSSLTIVFFFFSSLPHTACKHPRLMESFNPFFWGGWGCGKFEWRN